MGIFTHVNGWCGATWYPPGGITVSHPIQPGKQENRPRIRDGTKAATTNNYLILPILYSSGKQGKIKSRECFPACYYLKNFPPLQFNLARSKHTMSGVISIIKAIINTVSTVSHLLYFFTYFTSLTITRSDTTNLFLNRL